MVSFEASWNFLVSPYCLDDNGFPLDYFAVLPRDVAPAAAIGLILFCGIAVAIAGALKWMHHRVDAELAAVEAETNELLIRMREEQAAHQADIDELRNVGERTVKELEAAQSALRLKKTKCARRVAFVRHLRAVNHRAESDLTDLRMVSTVQLEELETQHIADVDPTSPQQQRSQGDLSPEQIAAAEDDDAVATTSPAPARPTNESPKGRYGSYDASASTCPRRSEIRDPETLSLSYHLDDVFRAMRRAAAKRDFALNDVKQLETDQEELQATLAALEETHDAYRKNAATVFAEIKRRVRLDAKMRKIAEGSVEATAAHRSPKQNGGSPQKDDDDDQFVDVYFPIVLRDTDEATGEEMDITLPDKGALLEHLFRRHGMCVDPFDDDQMDELYRDCERLDHSNETLGAALAKGWAELDELQAYAEDQEDLIAEMDQVIEADQLQRDVEATELAQAQAEAEEEAAAAAAAAAAEAEDEDGEEAQELSAVISGGGSSPRFENMDGNDDTLRNADEETQEGEEQETCVPLVRGPTLEEETLGYANYVETATEDLQVARASLAEVLQQHQLLQQEEESFHSPLAPQEEDDDYVPPPVVEVAKTVPLPVSPLPIRAVDANIASPGVGLRPKKGVLTRDGSYGTSPAQRKSASALAPPGTALHAMTQSPLSVIDKEN